MGRTKHRNKTKTKTDPFPGGVKRGPDHDVVVLVAVDVDHTNRLPEFRADLKETRNGLDSTKTSQLVLK